MVKNPKTSEKNLKVTEVKNLLNPKIDYVFKRIFGHTGSEEITKGLITAIIKQPIENITIDCNPITEKDLLDDKVGILDIKAKLNNNINCNIEMQIVDKKNIEKGFYFIGVRCILVVLKKEWIMKN